VERTSQFFFNFLSSQIHTRNVAKIKLEYAFEIMPFLCIDFGSIFWQNGFEKNSRWHPIFKKKSSKIDKTENFTQEKSVFALL
jgi:hypothetical protein